MIYTCVFSTVWTGHLRLRCFSLWEVKLSFCVELWVFNSVPRVSAKAFYTTLYCVTEKSISCYFTNRWKSLADNRGDLHRQSKSFKNILFLIPYSSRTTPNLFPHHFVIPFLAFFVCMAIATFLHCSLPNSDAMTDIYSSLPSHIWFPLYWGAITQCPF